MNKKLTTAMERATKRMLKLNPEEIKKKLENHKNGDIAKILKECGYFNQEADNES